MMIRDGEGVQRIAEVVVKGARSTQEAVRVGRTIADSPLVKTALHGGDPNWDWTQEVLTNDGSWIEVAEDLTLDDIPNVWTHAANSAVAA